MSKGWWLYWRDFTVEVRLCIIKTCSKIHTPSMQSFMFTKCWNYAEAHINLARFSQWINAINMIWLIEQLTFNIKKYQSHFTSAQEIPESFYFSSRNTRAILLQLKKYQSHFTSVQEIPEPFYFSSRCCYFVVWFEILIYFVYFSYLFYNTLLWA